jgi:hypothetical protein
MAMKYVKLFENWLLTEGEGVSKPFTDFTIGDLRSSTDKAQLLTEFFEQFTFVPENKKTIASGQTLELTNVEVKDLEYKGTVFNSNFYGKDNKDKKANIEIFEKEVKEAYTEEELEKMKKKALISIDELKLLFGQSDITGNQDHSLDGYEYLLSKYENVEKKFSAVKESKILPILQKDIEKIKKRIEYINANFPNGKGTEVNLNLNLQIKGGGSWESDSYTLIISKDLADTSKNPDGAKLTEFTVSRFFPQPPDPDRDFQTTLGNIGIWLDNAVRSFKSDTALLQQDKTKSQPMYANIMKDVKQYTAKLKKSKK